VRLPGVDDAEDEPHDRPEAEGDQCEDEVQDVVDLRLGHHPLLLADVAPTGRLG
jgi:hypothetical protein